MSTKFILRFFPNIPPKRSSEQLYQCKQKENEPLREYLERFNNEVTKIEDLNIDTAVQALRRGTTMGRLTDKIYAKPPKTYQDLMLMAQKCVSIDDGRRYRRAEKEEIETKKKEKKEEKPKPQTYQPHKHNYKPYRAYNKPYQTDNRLYQHNPERRESNFTPLNQPRTNVLMWIRDNQTPYNRPRPMIQRSRNTSRFCKFHED